MWCLHSHFVDEAFVVKGSVICPASLPSPELLHFTEQVTRDWAEAGVGRTIQAGLSPGPKVGCVSLHRLHSGTDSPSKVLPKGQVIVTSSPFLLSLA